MVRSQIVRVAASHIEAAQPRVGGGTARVDEADDGAVGQFGPESEAQAQLALIHAHHHGLALLDQQTTRAQAVRLHFAGQPRTRRNIFEEEERSRNRKRVSGVAL